MFYRVLNVKCMYKVQKYTRVYLFWLHHNQLDQNTYTFTLKNHPTDEKKINTNTQASIQLGIYFLRIEQHVNLVLVSINLSPPNTLSSEYYLQESSGSVWACSRREWFSAILLCYSFWIHLVSLFAYTQSAQCSICLPLWCHPRFWAGSTQH